MGECAWRNPPWRGEWRERRQSASPRRLRSRRSLHLPRPSRRAAKVTRGAVAASVADRLGGGHCERSVATAGDSTDHAISFAVMPFESRETHVHGRGRGDGAVAAATPGGATVDAPEAAGGAVAVDQPPTAVRARFGIVHYLNSWPLAWTFLRGAAPAWAEPVYLPPSRVAYGLAGGELEVGLVPSAELQRIPGLAVVPGLCIASQHEVKSVLLVS